MTTPKPDIDREVEIYRRTYDTVLTRIAFDVVIA